MEGTSYRIRHTRSQTYPITTLYAHDRFLVIHCVGEWDEQKAIARVVALYEQKEKERECSTPSTS